MGRGMILFSMIFYFIFPFADFSAEHFRGFYRIHIGLDIGIVYDRGSLFTAPLTEAIFDDDIGRVAIKIFIRKEALLDEGRKSLSACASFTDFYSDGSHGQSIDKRCDKAKKSSLLVSKKSPLNGRFFSISAIITPRCTSILLRPPRTSHRAQHGSFL